VATDLKREEAAADYAISQTAKRLKKAGLSRTYTYNKLKSLCEATKPISCIRGKEADGGTVDFVDVPDNRVQLDAVKTVIAMYGDLAPEKHEHDIGGSLMAAVAARLADGTDTKPKD
jgi:hypothetical protein